MNKLIPVLLLALTAGCRSPRDIVPPDDASWIRPSDVGGGRAHLSGVQKGLPFDSETKDLPEGFNKTVVEDDVTLAKFDDAQVCVDMSFRTALSADRPLREWEIYVNGVRLKSKDLVSANEERLAVRDFSYDGRGSALQAKGVASTLTYDPPDGNVLRVMEREGQLCFDRKWVPGKALSLEVQGSGHRHTFSWVVSSANAPNTPK